MHLGEIRDKKRPLFVVFIGEYNDFACSIFELTVACLSSYHTQENFAGFYCVPMKSYGDVYRTLYTCAYATVTKQKFVSGM